MEKIKEFIENNKLNCDILNYYYGHEATKGCKSGNDNINPYALVYDKEKEEKYYILVLSNTNSQLFHMIQSKQLKNIKHHGILVIMDMSLEQ